MKSESDKFSTEGVLRRLGFGRSQFMSPRFNAPGWAPVGRSKALFYTRNTKTKGYVGTFKQNKRREA